MKIKLNIDTRGYKEKPSAEAAAISNRTRCQAGQREIEPAQLLEQIRSGHTFTPALIGDKSSWISQQVIAADIDNKHDEEIIDFDNAWLDENDHLRGKSKSMPNKYRLTPARALEACRAAGLEPFCIYKSFSYTPELEKFRVMLLLKEPITEFSKAEELIDKFCGLFNAEMIRDYEAAGEAPELCADTSIEPVKLIFGGRADCIIYQAEAYTSIAALEALPQAPETPPKKGAGKKKGKNTRKASEAPSRARRGMYDYFYDVGNFDIARYLLDTAGCIESSKAKDVLNPCPICGHNDCLHISGAVWYCHSSSHEAGGNIIDYLEQYHNLSRKDARNMFMDEIMHYPAEAIQESQARRSNRDISDYEPPTEAEIMQALEKYQEIDAGEISAPVPAEDPAGAEDPGADPAAQEQEINAAAADPTEQAGTPEEIQGPADPTEDPNMQSLVANMPPTAGKAPSTPRKTPGKIINAADYLRPAQDGISGYDADIAEVMKYAGRKMGLHPDIDRYLTLYPGLAVMGGQASLGKTTFCVNIASKLLERGEHVLYFALEQTPDEIMTKAAARYIYEAGEECAADNIALNSGARDPYIENAISELAENSRNFNIIDCDFETTAAEIIATCEQYMRMHPGVKPIPIIDYLQIIAPPADFKGTKGEAVDENLKALKKWQKNNGLFVLLISSFNRSNNILPVSYESFMLTSAIEYTCDYVFGLQLQLLDPDNKDFYIKEGSRGGESDQKKFEQRRQVQEANAKTPKEVQFVSLKNRKGKQFFKANFNYYPAHDFFEPIAARRDNFLPTETIDRTSKTVRSVPKK